MLGYALEFAASRRAAEDDGRGQRRAARIGHVAVGITGFGWLLHLGAVTTRGIATDRAPWGNMYEFSMMASLIAVTLFGIGVWRWGMRRLGAFVLAPIVLYLGIAGTELYAKAGELPPALHSYWIWIHVAAATSATGAFMLSGVVTVLYLLKDRWERGLPPLRVALRRRTLAHAGRLRRPTAVSIGPGTAAVAEFQQSPAPVADQADDAGGVVQRWPSGLMDALPDAPSLERLANRIITFAFPVWTFAIMAGAIWANSAWSRYWGWDPKETWSFITWLGYAAYLHARATGGWRGRKAATVSLVAFGCLIVNFYVINVLIHGLHSYAGISAT